MPGKGPDDEGKELGKNWERITKFIACQLVKWYNTFKLENEYVSDR